MLVLNEDIEIIARNVNFVCMMDVFSRIPVYFRTKMEQMVSKRIFREQREIAEKSKISLYCKGE